MTQEAMSGIDFEISGVVQTEGSFYTILVDESLSLYFPIPCGEAHAYIIDGVMSEKFPFSVETLGLYFTFASLLKANGVSVTAVAIVVGKNRELTCYIDMVQENELGLKVSRIPSLMPDAMVLCSIFGAPAVVYGAAGTEFAFSIDKNIPKQSIFAFICSDISRSEKLMAMRHSK